MNNLSVEFDVTIPSFNCGWKLFPSGFVRIYFGFALEIVNKINPVRCYAENSRKCPKMESSRISADMEVMAEYFFLYLYLLGIGASGWTSDEKWLCVRITHGHYVPFYFNLILVTYSENVFFYFWLKIVRILNSENCVHYSSKMQNQWQFRKTLIKPGDCDVLTSYKLTITGCFTMLGIISFLFSVGSR